MQVGTRVRLNSRLTSRGEGVVKRQIIARSLSAFVVVQWGDGSESTERVDQLQETGL